MTISDDSLDRWEKLLEEVLSEVEKVHEGGDEVDEHIRLACKALRDPKLFLGCYAVMPAIIRTNILLAIKFAQALGFDFEIAQVMDSPTEKVH